MVALVAFVFWIEAREYEVAYYVDLLINLLTALIEGRANIYIGFRYVTFIFIRHLDEMGSE